MPGACVRRAAEPMMGCVSPCPRAPVRGSVARRCPQTSAPCMPSSQLGATDVRVSRLGLGTMTFGERNSYEESAHMLSLAADGGVTLFDSAEMYPVPQRAETQGRSERFLGRWLRESGRVGRVTVATKVAGPAAMPWLRGGPLRLDGANLTAAVDGCLTRLGVECVDLLQIHWPDRYVPMFGDVAFDAAADYGDWEPVREQLGVLASLVAAGKVRHLGLSNETPWGLMRFLFEAEASDGALPRVAALQNAYSLTCRLFEATLAECCHREHVSLLAYSPLAMGLLTGKYFSPGGAPPTARLNLYRGRYAEAEGRYPLDKPNVRHAVDAYTAIASRHGMTATALALRFSMTHPAVASSISGATDAGQLAQLLAAAHQGPLPQEVLHDIEAVHEQFPNPTP